MRYIALLRAVNVGGRKVVMKDLKAMAEGLGFENCRTLLASGNLIFETRKTAPAKLEALLEAEIKKTFGLFSDVMVRDPAQWDAIVKANPFPKKAQDDPAHLVVGVGKGPPNNGALAAYLKTFREKWDKGEKVEVVGRDIFIDYGDSIGLSKLVLPSKIGTGTARNWNTVLKIQAALNA